MAPDDPLDLVPPRPARRGWALLSRRAHLAGTVYLLLDCSASMGDRGKLERLKAGALRFFAEAYLRRYAVGAVAFSGRAYCLSGASQDFRRFGRAIRGLQADGSTAMAEAIRLAAWRLRLRRGHRVLMLITDGQPDDPAAALRAARAARAAGIELIAVGVDGADEAFLAALVPRPELAWRSPADAREEGVAAGARALPETSPQDPP
jgi:Mg-chelatase subunit ChlD